MTIYTHAWQTGPCSWVLACTFVLLSVAGGFLCIDRMEILSSPLFRVLFLPTLLPPTQQTCVTLPSRPGAHCSDSLANRPELACTAGTWLADSIRLDFRNSSLAALQSACWIWASYLLWNFCSSWTLQQFSSPWVICIVPGRESNKKPWKFVPCLAAHSFYWLECCFFYSRYTGDCKTNERYFNLWLQIFWWNCVTGTKATYAGNWASAQIWGSVRIITRLVEEQQFYSLLYLWAKTELLCHALLRLLSSTCIY